MTKARVQPGSKKALGEPSRGGRRFQEHGVWVEDGPCAELIMYVGAWNSTRESACVLPTTPHKEFRKSPAHILRLAEEVQQATYITSFVNS